SIYKELQKESLFNEWTDELMRLNSTYDNDNYAVEIWNIAKDYVYNIATAEYPLGMFKICHSEIKNKYLSFSRLNVYKTCLGCIYTMILKSADKAVVEQITNNISVYDFLPTYRNSIISIIEKIKKGELKDDYDYTKKKDSQNADANKVNTTDNGKTQALEKRIQELEKNKEELEEELAEYKKGPIVDKPHNKVVLELFVKLLEKSGVDFKVRCNKAIAARLAEYVTGIKKDACNKYMCYKDLSTSYHKDEVNKVNDQLRLLNINIKL
ncbi:MAG: hypothetical protein MR017_02750, partial [Paraprevotella sp.]|nr:hypothetical protein [Paraprevotella sp.]